MIPPCGRSSRLLPSIKEFSGQAEPSAGLCSRTGLQHDAIRESPCQTHQRRLPLPQAMAWSQSQSLTYPARHHLDRGANQQALRRSPQPRHYRRGIRQPFEASSPPIIRWPSSHAHWTARILRARTHERAGCARSNEHERRALVRNKCSCSCRERGSPDPLRFMSGSGNPRSRQELKQCPPRQRDRRGGARPRAARRPAS